MRRVERFARFSVTLGTDPINELIATVSVGARIQMRERIKIKAARMLISQLAGFLDIFERFFAIGLAVVFSAEADIKNARGDEAGGAEDSLRIL